MLNFLNLTAKTIFLKEKKMKYKRIWVVKQILVFPVRKFKIKNLV